MRVAPLGLTGQTGTLVRPPSPICSCKQRRGWWSGDVVAGQLPPTGNQLLASGLERRRNPVASPQRPQLPVKHNGSGQPASINRMTAAPRARQRERQPTRWEWGARPTGPWQLLAYYQRNTDWDETNLFYFLILGVSQVGGSNLWLVVNSWVLIKARPEFTALQIKVVH